MLNLPDGLMDFIDELADARVEALDNGENCESFYAECPSETLSKLLDHFSEASR